MELRKVVARRGGQALTIIAALMALRSFLFLVVVASISTPRSVFQLAFWCPLSAALVHYGQCRRAVAVTVKSGCTQYGRPARSMRHHVSLGAAGGIQRACASVSGLRHDAPAGPRPTPHLRTSQTCLAWH